MQMQAVTAPPCGCADWIGGLARDHASRLAAVARGEGLSPADALDAVQEAFQTVLGRTDMAALRDRPEDAANVLVALVRNAARNARRRHFRAQPHVDVEATPLADDAPAPDEAIDRATATERLSGCLARLGDVHRHVVTLRVLEEMSGEDAAKELGVTAGHVAVLLHRARKQLADCMQTSG
jgi:RNA polymerase sigma-70 factor, ECF subfamily